MGLWLMKGVVLNTQYSRHCLTIFLIVIFHPLVLDLSQLPVQVFSDDYLSLLILPDDSHHYSDDSLRPLEK